MNNSQPAINIDRVSVEFGRDRSAVLALDNVSLSAVPGELVALVGASGSGKSTLLNVVAGLQPVSGGAVNVAGDRLSELSPRAVAAIRLESIGVVFQDHNLIPEFTAAENIMVPLLALGWGHQESRQEAQRRLEQVDLDGLQDRLPRELSGGQQQRVGVARAVAGGKSVILGDEPTGALDSTNTKMLFSLLRALADDGACVVVATHDLSIASYASRVVRLLDGSIQDTATERENA